MSSCGGLAVLDAVSLASRWSRLVPFRPEAGRLTTGVDSAHVPSLALPLQERHGALPLWTHLIFERLASRLA